MSKKGNNNNNNNHNNNNNNNNNEKDDRSIAEVLVDLISQNSNTFFKDQYEIPHARIYNGDRFQNIRVESSKFKRHLIRLYYESENRVANTEAVYSAVQVLQAKAEYEGQTYPLSVRVASYNGSFFYDLTNPKWECIQITKQGWQAVDDTPVPLFTRFNQTTQIQPSRYYEPDIFERFMSLTNVRNADDKKLLKVYIISLFIPDIQHVIFQTCGEKGGAKSMLEVLIKELVDPAKPKLLSVHKDRMEFIQQVAQNYLVFYDNLKYPPRWLSDEACRAVTGSGSSKRKLYTDDDSIVCEYKRCLGFNGISLVLTEPDALDRSIIIEQDRIDKKNRIPELVILSQFYDLRPKLLGYIFDILVKAMNIKPTIKLDGYPRMADFAEWGEAIARAMGYNENEFIDILDNNTGKQNAEAIENSVLGQVITRFLNGPNLDFDFDSGFCYENTVSEFLIKLNDIATLNKINTNFKGWPKAANSLTRRLKAIASNIKDGLGFEISIIRNTAGKDRGVSSVKVWKISSQPEHPRSGQNRAQNETLDDKIDGTKTPNSGSYSQSEDTSDSVGQSEDTLGSEDMYPRSDTISAQQNQENRAQNGALRGCEDSEDIDRNLAGDPTVQAYSCYHCNGFQTSNQDYYENHMARYHYRLPAYPSAADLQRYGLKAQGKSWEK